MQKRPELEWVGYVLRDVVTFLAENEMMQSAQKLAVAAAQIENDIRQKPSSQLNVAAEVNVVRFPCRRQRLLQ